MGVDLRESRRERSVEMRAQDDSSVKERWDGGYDGMDGNGFDELRESSKYRSKDKSKSSGRRDDKDRWSKDRERSKTSESLKETDKEGKDLEKERASSRDRRKDDRDERGKDKARAKVREKDAADRDRHRDKDRDKDRKDRGKEKDREREKVLEKDGDRGRDRERAKDKSRDKDKDRDRTKEREREKLNDRERERKNDRDIGKEAIEREKGKERTREKEKQADQDKERARDRDKSSRKPKDESHDRSKDLEKDDNSRLEGDYARDKHIGEGMGYLSKDNSKGLKHQNNVEDVAGRSVQSTSELGERISIMREERLKRKSEGVSEVLSWVDRSRKLEAKRNVEKEKVSQLSRIFEEQDNINEGESDDEAAVQHETQNLGGVKILHGLDKVIEGGAVVLTLKDQSVLADGDINEEVDMLENVEMGEQKRRDEAYKAAKKKTGIYDDKFIDEPGAEKKILPQYDDPVADEGVTLDASGRFTGEAEKKLEELRKRIQGVPASNHVEDLNSTGKISTDYYTQEEMLKFRKPKKKKSLRKKEKLDIDALEADAISAGLGSGDLGSRNDGRLRNLREEQEKSEAENRRNAYQSAYARAEEASKALRPAQTHTMKPEEDDTPVFGDDDDELRKSLEMARKLALKMQDEAEKSGLQIIAHLVTSTANDSTADKQNSGSGEPQEDKVVFTEMEEFVWGLQLDEEAQKPEDEDVFMDEDVAPSTDQEKKDEGGWAEVEVTMEDATPTNDEEEEVVPDETIHESAVGKGLAGALKLLKDRGTLKETVEWGGRNMDKKKSKLVGIYDNDGKKEIHIERTDEYGRILTPKEAFRLLSHKFHGKGPGKMKQEKRMRQYQEELKVKQMKNADTPSLSVERMKEAQAKLKTPYLVLSGHVKPGQTSDPASGFATVEKDLTGGLTPMLGDKKVEHFLNMKRGSGPGDSMSHKKPKT